MRAAHDLAKGLQLLNVRQMLSDITYSQWLHWRVYMELAPFNEERMDIRFASVVQAIWNSTIAVYGKRGEDKPRDIHDLILRFGDTPEYLPPAAKRDPTGSSFSNLVAWLKLSANKVVGKHT